MLSTPTQSPSELGLATARSWSALRRLGACAVGRTQLGGLREAAAAPTDFAIYTLRLGGEGRRRAALHRSHGARDRKARGLAGRIGAWALPDLAQKC